MANVLQTLRTLRHLRFAQVLHRVKNKLLGVWFASPLYAVLFLSDGLGLPALVTPPNPWGGDKAHGELMGRGMIRLVGLDGPLKDPVNWDPKGYSHLWRFTLHYWEWLADLEAAGDRTTAQRLVKDWLERFERPDRLAWHPYPLSLRVYAALRHAPFVLQGADETLKLTYWRSLHRQACHIDHVLEKDVGGNHLIKNRKVQIAAALCLPGHEGKLANALTKLEGQLALQVLADGGHYERSPSYHLMVLCDLIDLRDLFRVVGKEAPGWLAETARRMKTALAALRHPDGGLALFNDGSVGDRRVLDKLKTEEPPRSLPQTGYYRLQDGETLVIADAGAICPDDLPAHAHADTLSFEMSSGARRIVVNCGTYAYQDPLWRPFFRGTPAHSTLCVDGRNSAEVYGIFRVGSRPRDVRARFDGNRLEASHDGYRYMGLTHHRTLSLEEGGRVLRGVDRVTGHKGPKSRELAVRFHLHPDVHAQWVNDGAANLSVYGGEKWRFEARGGTVRVLDSVYSPQFGVLEDTEKIKITAPLTGEEAVIEWSLRRCDS